MPTRGGFSAKLKFSVYSGFLSSAVRCQPLSRRYATQVNLGAQSFGISPAIRFVLLANEDFHSQIRG
ncbi:hypothetical protein FKQ62_12480 [Vibrio sp. B1-2]|nr:hypothetical protein CEQ50_17340 [Vibrio anguillarum]NNO00262.1 hypothetical protein [Vibrio sp. B1-2]